MPYFPTPQVSQMERPVTSTVSSKGQTTIPARVRRQLKIEPGDTIRYEMEEGGVRIHKTTRLDVEWARSVESTLTEWTGDEDDDL